MEQLLTRRRIKPMNDEEDQVDGGAVDGKKVGE